MTASGARHVGNIASLITGTVQEVTREIGEWITDVIEMNAAARRDTAAQRADRIEPDTDRCADLAVEPDTATEFVEVEVVEPEPGEPR